MNQQASQAISEKFSSLPRHYADSVITITEAAAQKIWELIEEKNNFNLKLRAFITGGGCSGFQYDFAFIEAVDPDDVIIKRNFLKRNEKADQIQVTTNNKNYEEVTIILVIDSLSLQYLKNSEIDYKFDVNGERFIIRNPNAKTTCGCGSSFAI